MRTQRTDMRENISHTRSSLVELCVATYLHTNIMDPLQVLHITVMRVEMEQAKRAYTNHGIE